MKTLGYLLLAYGLIVALAGRVQLHLFPHIAAYLHFSDMVQGILVMLR